MTDQHYFPLTSDTEVQRHAPEGWTDERLLADALGVSVERVRHLAAVHTVPVFRAAYGRAWLDTEGARRLYRLHVEGRL